MPTVFYDHLNPQDTFLEVGDRDENWNAIESLTVIRNHVYKDLRPYVCTFVDCTAPDRLFETRNRWSEHEAQAHMRWWECVDGCKKPFNSKSAFEDHIRHTHQNLFIGNQFPALVNMQERQMNPKTQIECPLCKEMVQLSSHLRRHLGKHQEQLALFALPSNLEQTEEENKLETAELRFCTIIGKVETLHVTIDQSMSVNVITNKCLARLGFKPLQHAMPSKLSELASQAFPRHYGWQKLCLFAPSGHRGISYDVDFLVVGDDYYCDLLLGCEFKRLTQAETGDLSPILDSAR
jgi:hypothetical protein